MLNFIGHKKIKIVVIMIQYAISHLSNLKAFKIKINDSGNAFMKQKLSCTDSGNINLYNPFEVQFGNIALRALTTLLYFDTIISIVDSIL